jgi:hypothetical protein
MPTAVRQMNNFKNSGNNLVHYTSAENAINIIKSKTFWMRNTRCMNDYMEVEHGCDCLTNFFSNPMKRQEFCKSIDACFEDAGTEILTRFDE